MDDTRKKLNDIEARSALTGPQQIDLMKQNLIQQIEDMDKLRLKRATEKYFGWEIGGFPIMSECFDGLHEGLIILAADSNIGKTTLMVNMTIGVLEANAEPEIIFCTFDDSLRNIQNYFISRMSGLSMVNLWKMENVGTEFDEVDKAKKELQGYIDRDQLLFCEPKTLDELEKIINLKYIHATHGGRYVPESKVMPCPFVVFVDGWDYIDGLRGKTDMERDTEIADRFKRMVIDYEIPIICTSEIRKEQVQQYLKEGQKAKKRLLTLADVNGNKRKVYRANAVIILQPDNPVEFHDSSYTTADIIANYAKNKMGQVKGLSKLRLHKIMTKIEEVGLIGTGNYVFGKDDRIDSLNNAIKG